MPTFRAEFLQRSARRIFEAAGTPPPIASRVAEILTGSNLAGHDSHGILRVPAYLDQIAAGTLLPAEEPEILRETAAAALVDARQGWGHYAADWAMALAVRKAREAGACTVVLRRCNHIGRLGEYVERAAEEGVVGSVWMGAGGRGRGCAAPLGGVERGLGTNPFAFGVPTGGPPFVLDFATTVAAEGKLQVLRSKGLPAPEGWIVDREGRPAADTAAFYDGGSLVFAGGHKGYGLSLFACLTAMLNGAFEPDGWRCGGVVVQALDPAAFMPLDEYEACATGFLEGLRTVRPAEGREILCPGEPEARARAQRLECGIEVPAATWEEIAARAGDLGVSLES